jgi:hypothetical protein
LLDVSIQRVCARGWVLVVNTIQIGVKRYLRIDRYAAAPGQTHDEIGPRGTVVVVGREMALCVEVEVLDETGGLDDLLERGLPPPTAHAGPAQGLRELPCLAHELLLLPRERPDHATEFAGVAPLIEMESLHRLAKLGEVR